MRCVELGKVRRVLDETPSGDPATVVEGLTRHSPLATRQPRRRGVTLVEMLVTLAVLLMMMTVIVQIFQAATGALNAAQVYQELDNQLRLLDSTIRSDLDGVTCQADAAAQPQEQPGLPRVRRERVRRRSGRGLATTTSGSPPRPPPAGRSRGGCGFRRRLGRRRHQLFQPAAPADHDHQRVRRDHLLPAQRQPLPPRAAGRARAAVGDRADGQQRRTTSPYNGHGFYPIALGGNPVEPAAATR